MKLVWLVIPLVLFGIVGIQESYSQYLGPTYNEMTDKERDQYNEEKRLHLEQFNSRFEQEYPNYYYCSKILQIPFICTLVLAEISLYFLLFGIIGSTILGIIIIRKKIEG